MGEFYRNLPEQKIIGKIPLSRNRKMKVNKSAEVIVSNARISLDSLAELFSIIRNVSVSSFSEKEKFDLKGDINFCSEQNETATLSFPEMDDEVVQWIKKRAIRQIRASIKSKDTFFSYGEVSFHFIIGEPLTIKISGESGFVHAMHSQLNEWKERLPTENFRFQHFLMTVVMPLCTTVFAYHLFIFIFELLYIQAEVQVSHPASIPDSIILLIFVIVIVIGMSTRGYTRLIWIPVYLDIGIPTRIGKLRTTTFKVLKWLIAVAVPLGFAIFSLIR